MCNWFNKWKYKGDDLAFHELVSTYQEKCIAKIERYVNSRSIAEEFAQEVFMYLDAARSWVTDFDHFEALFHTISRRKALDYIKKRQRRAKLLEEKIDEVKDWTKHLQNPHDQLERREFLELVEDCLDELTERHRRILILRCIDEFGYDEIGLIIGNSRVQAKAMFEHAKKRLKQLVLNRLKRNEF